ncbi:MAG: anthranilate phosphoribosyltransferase [Pirellulales bacterium]|nr:anthranilate phosphoribosyltransferase [Pirellulales bacterium]
MIGPFLELVESGESLSMDQMAQTIGIIMEGKSTEDQISRLLVALHRKGESVEEVAGAALAMRRHMTPIHTTRADVVDVVGTGGDGSRTFNISTAAALVTAAAGVPVAKHGNRAMTSRSGSADVLTELGVNVEADVAVVEACLDQLGICFCFAPLLHKAMKHVAHVRQKLGTPTVFNLLGPLANPAGASMQLLGVSSLETQSLMAGALALLGCRRALVVHGEGGLDEVSLSGTTQVVDLQNAQERVFEWNPSDFGFEKVKLDDLRVDGPAQSAQRIRSVLQNRPGPATDIVIANAAAALWLVGRAPTVAGCVPLATEALESGAAADLLARLVEQTNQSAPSGD